MCNQFVERLVDDAVRERIGLPGGAQLQQETLTQVARADARRIQVLNDLQHRQHLVVREDGDIDITFTRIRGRMIEEEEM